MMRGPHPDAGAEQWRPVIGPLVDDLIDDYVVNVDVLVGQLLDQALCFVEAEELWNADADEGRHLRVLELLVHILHCRL